MELVKKHTYLIGIIIGGLLLCSIGIYIFFEVKEGQHIVNDGKITIGFCTDNLVIERWQRDQKIFREEAVQRGVEVIFYNANEDNANQNNQIRQLIEKNVDVIVVIPYDKDGIAEVVTQARKAGIKVIAYDRLIKGAAIDAYISFDNVKVGELQAKALIDLAPKGKYVIINGSEEDNNSTMFNEGAMNILHPYLENGDIQLVAEGWADDWREESSYELVSNLIAEEVKIDAIIGANDRLAEAAIKALSEEGIAGEVYVAGHDADISACQRIVEGTQHVTIYKPLHLLAGTAVDLAIQLAEGEEIEVKETIHNGVIDVPYIKLDVLTVTKETMEKTVIADEFHQKEDIYRE